MPLPKSALLSPASDTTYDELFEQVKNVPLLVLDDLALGSATAWAKEKLEQLLHHRFNIKLATVLTTDVPMERIDERLRGHLADNEFCQVWTIEQKLPSEPQGSFELELSLTINGHKGSRSYLWLSPSFWTIYVRHSVRTAKYPMTNFSRSSKRRRC